MNGMKNVIHPKKVIPISTFVLSFDKEKCYKIRQEQLCQIKNRISVWGSLTLEVMTFF